jgi:hypothetical protein
MARTWFTTVSFQVDDRDRRQVMFVSRIRAVRECGKCRIDPAGDAEVQVESAGAKSDTVRIDLAGAAACRPPAQLSANP